MVCVRMERGMVMNMYYCTLYSELLGNSQGTMSCVD